MSENRPDDCPACGADNRGNPIPQSYIDRGLYTPDLKYYTNIVSVEIPEVYDGGLFWLYPCCGHLVNRWPEDHYLHTPAEKEMKKWLKSRAEHADSSSDERNQ